MLSFELDNNLINKIKELSYKMAVKDHLLQGFDFEKKKAIGQYARVSQIGASTRIENAVLTDAEIGWIDTILTQDSKTTSFLTNKNLIENKLSKDRERSIEEVAGCRGMLFLVYEQYADFFPLTESALRGLHHELLKYYPKASHYLGKYKSSSNSVVSFNQTTQERRTIFKTADPGPFTEIAMKELVEWYNQNLPSNPYGLAVACEMTFRFLAIHPFQDGNGRLGRGLFLLALLQSPDKILSHLARYLAIDRQIEKHKEEYYFVLQQCSKGVFSEDSKKYKINHFLNYMIKILSLALEDIDFYSKRYDSIKELPEASHTVLNCFKEFPEKRLATGEVVTETDLPRRTVNYSIDLLVKVGLLQKYGKGRGVRYQVTF